MEGVCRISEMFHYVVVTGQGGGQPGSGGRQQSTGLTVTPLTSLWILGQHHTHPALASTGGSGGQWDVTGTVLLRAEI